MTPSQTDPIALEVGGEGSGAVLLRPTLTVLTQRRDFQRMARGKRVAMPGFVLQMLRRPEGDSSGIRIGYTCSKKVGNAVARNRAKRRLREIARLTLPDKAQSGHDYVLIGRREATAKIPFNTLTADLEKALDILQGTRR